MPKQTLMKRMSLLIATNSTATWAFLFTNNYTYFISENFLLLGRKFTNLN
jgi:hypothetical protein